MITRRVDKDDGLAGFTYSWVKKIGENVDSLNVICLYQGNVSDLPNNISIYSVGKEKKIGKIKSLINFCILANRLIKKCDGVFCHQNPEYTIAIWPWAKLFRKKIVTWYTHGSVSFRLRLVEKMADVILTASKDSFRLPSKKVFVTGHGIDVNLFKPSNHENSNNLFKILTVGRISPTKDYESMIKALAILPEQDINHIQFDIIGQPGLVGQKIYFENLKKMVEVMKLNNQINFLGAKPNSEIPNFLRAADLFINLSGTGSLDKAVLEAMACGCLVLTSNFAFKDILPSELFVLQNNPKQLAQKIKSLIDFDNSTRNNLKEKMINEVVTHHNLDNLIKIIITKF